VEAGGQEPSSQNTLNTLFYPDPSQRILALCLDIQEDFSVMKVETLLRLAGERAGGEIQWREWSPYLSPTSLRWGGVFHQASCDPEGVSLNPHNISICRASFGHDNVVYQVVGGFSSS